MILNVLDDNGNVVHNLGYLSPWTCAVSLVINKKLDEGRQVMGEVYGYLKRDGLCS